MWGSGKWHRRLLLAGFLLVSGTFAQDQQKGKPMIFWPPGFPGNTRNILQAQIKQEMEYSLSVSASQYINKSKAEKEAQFTSLQSLKYEFLLHSCNSLTFSGKITHDLGLKFFADSITDINPDETSLSTNLSGNLCKKIKISLVTNTSTRLLNKSEQVTDKKGNVVRVTGASFLTPLISDFSLGFSFSQSGVGEICLGISSARLTMIIDHDVFRDLNTDQFYGIPKGKNHVFEYGLSIRLLIDKELWKTLHWNCDLLIFKNYLTPADLSLKNHLSINLNKYITTSIRTRILYEHNISKSLRMENHINIGFSLHL